MGRLGLGQKLLKHSQKLRGRLKLRQVTDPIKDLETATGDTAVRVLAMTNRDDWTASTPCPVGQVLRAPVAARSDKKR